MVWMKSELLSCKCFLHQLSETESYFTAHQTISNPGFTLISLRCISVELRGESTVSLHHLRCVSGLTS